MTHKLHVVTFLVAKAHKAAFFWFCCLRHYILFLWFNSESFHSGKSGPNYPIGMDQKTTPWLLECDCMSYWFTKMRERKLLCSSIIDCWCLLVAPYSISHCNRTLGSPASDGFQSGMPYYLFPICVPESEPVPSHRMVSVVVVLIHAMHQSISSVRAISFDLLVERLNRLT
jgi:hypothetical protein